MTNIEALRKLIADTPQAEEANEFLDALQDDLDDKPEPEEVEVEKELTDEEEKDVAEDYISMHFSRCNLGLDTLEYRLTNGNLKVTMQLEHWMEQMRKVNCVSNAPVLLDID